MRLGDWFWAAAFIATLALIGHVLGIDGGCGPTDCVPDRFYYP